MEVQTILLVEDEADIREGIRILLAGENYTIIEAENGKQALKRMNDQVDLVILDVMMPGMSGLRVCEELRKSYRVPVLFLTAKAQKSDKLIGLTAGGDDYLTKPFSYAELIARVKALLRRYCVYQGKSQPGTAYEGDLLCCGGVKISLSHNQAWVDEKEVELTEIEYNILRILMQHPQQVFSAQMIYETVWNEPYFHISNGTVMVHIRRLRVKIEDDPQSPTRIRTVCGIGKGFAIGGILDDGGKCYLPVLSGSNIAHLDSQQASLNVKLVTAVLAVHQDRTVNKAQMPRQGVIHNSIAQGGVGGFIVADCDGIVQRITHPGLGLVHILGTSQHGLALVVNIGDFRGVSQVTAVGKLSGRLLLRRY